MNLFHWPFFFAFASATLAFVSAASGAHPSRGLWVGEVALNAVNEATGAVGDSNTYEFTDPELETPTSDTAYLRLIIHVNGAGQVNLLKSVAIVLGDTDANNGTDLLLLTDPSLYAEFPGIAKRVATAFYDFGNPQAVLAVRELVDTSTAIAVARALEGDTQGEIGSAVESALSQVVAQANVNAAYLDRGTGATSFLTDDFFSQTEVEALADKVAGLIHSGDQVVADFDYSDTSVSYAPFPSDPLLGRFAAVVGNAESLRDGSFYRDPRGIEAIVAIVTEAARAAAGMGASAELDAREAAARFAALSAWHNAADTHQAFNQFLAGEVFTGLPDKLAGAAAEAASGVSGADPMVIATTVRNALLAEGAFQAADLEAAALRSQSLWQDPRAQWALEMLLDAAVDAAVAQVLLDADVNLLTQKIAQSLHAAFRSINPALVFTSAPSADYSEFVNGSDFSSASEKAKDTAASEAYFQYNAGVTDEAALTHFTRRAVSQALLGTRNEAASLPQFAAPLEGHLVPGGSVEGTLHLPALAPTNPFLHRLHPDHPEGFPIQRDIRISVDGGAADVEYPSGGYGVSRLTGTYSEEIFGLHKPLGHNRNIGLKTKGTFSLSRLTLVDTLNF